MAAKRDPLETLGLKLKGDRQAGGAAVAPAKAGADKRARALRVEAEDKAQLRRSVQHALGSDLPDEAVGTITDNLATVRNAANVITARFLEIGRALRRVQELATEGGYRRLLQAGLVPFPEHTASKLRAVAAAVDGGKLPIEALPRTLEPAYAAAKLPDKARERLLKEDVIRPDSSRSEIAAAVRPPALAAPGGGRLTPDERRRLERLRDRLLAKLREIEARLAAG